MFLFCTIKFVDCMAQVNYAHLESSFVKREPTVLPKDLVKIDLNGDTLSVITVESLIDSLSFKGNIFGDVIKKSDNKIHKYLVNVTEGSRKITIKHNEYHQSEIIFPQPIGNNELWMIQVIGVDAPRSELVETKNLDFSHKVNINVEPWADLLIDEEKSNGGNVSFEEGYHYFTTSYGKDKYSQKININKDMNVDAKIGGTLTVKSSKEEPKFTCIDNAPIPILTKHKNKTYVYENMIGKYYITGQSKGVGILKSKDVKDNMEVGVRSNTTLRFDEMAGYGITMYQGCLAQPFGLNLGYCKNFGWYASYSCNFKSSIETPYGKTEFIKSSESGDTKGIKSTSQTIQTGPMFRVFRKLYLQAGGGLTVYLRTSEPKILTSDYKNVVGGAVNISAFYRINWIIFGAGYMHQFVKNAYNPDIANQLTFSVGVAL